MASQGKKCNSICVKAPGDRNKKPNAVSDPLSNVNRFMTIGQLDEFYDLVEKKLKNGERLCEEGWTEVGTGQGCKMDCENCELGLRKKIFRNFPNL